jgi:hypothetical protein
MSMSLTERCRRTVIVSAIAGLTLIPAGPAAAHVHGITPLRCVGNGPDGADATDSTPAAASNGGPITGLIPRDVGDSPLDIGDGGFDTPACPAP